MHERTHTDPKLSCKHPLVCVRICAYKEGRHKRLLLKKDHKAAFKIPAADRNFQVSAVLCQIINQRGNSP